jgi:hypothetical protein
MSVVAVGKHFPPPRSREEHAQRLAAELNLALTSAHQAGGVTARRATGETPGYYLDFTLNPQGREFIQSLENRQQGIELLSVKARDPEGEIHAIVFVPSGAETFFRKRIEAYRTEDTAKGRPKNERKCQSNHKVDRLSPHSA